MTMKHYKDGLTKWQRYRLKDIDRYRKLKREYARTPEERKRRTAYMRLWREKNREKHNAMARVYHQKHRTQALAAAKESRYRRRYGLTGAEVEKMKKGGCKICGSIKVLHIDHDHKTGKVRGVLCSACNMKVGWYERWKAKIEKYLD